MLTAAFIVLTLCFVVALALICAAPEAHEVEGRGFHLGAIEDCPLCVDRPLPPPCRSCGIGPCVCGEFDMLHHAPSHEAECLEARALVSPLHASEVSDA